MCRIPSSTALGYGMLSRGPASSPHPPNAPERSLLVPLPIEMCARARACVCMCRLSVCLTTHSIEVSLHAALSSHVPQEVLLACPALRRAISPVDVAAELVRQVLARTVSMRIQTAPQS